MSDYQNYRTIVDAVNQKLTQQRYLDAAEQIRNLSDSIGQLLGSNLSSGQSIDRHTLEDICDSLDTIMNHPNFNARVKNTWESLTFQSSSWTLYRFIRGMRHAMPIV